MRLAATAFLALLAVAGCNAQPGSSPSIALPTLPPDVTIPPSLSLPPELGQVPPVMFIDAAEQAAAVANVSIEQIGVVRAAAVTWNDGSLGCPEPGQVYTQALVPGYWLVLEAGGRQFDFRADQVGPPRLCAEGQGQPPINDR